MMLRTIKAYQSKNLKILRNHEKSNTFGTNLSLISNDFVKFNESIGLPLNRNTNLPQPLTPYQIEYYYAIEKYHKVIVNKSRKIGATEAAVRSISFNVFHKYVGHDVMVVAGNELRIAREILIRFDELFYDKKSGYAMIDEYGNKWRRDELIRKVKLGNSPEIEFHNDTRIMAYAASKSTKRQSFRGADDVACIFVSEAAHTGMKGDHAIMTALEPNLANRDDGDFILESTPNGKRGFFWDYWKATMIPLRKRFNTQDDWKVIRGLKTNNISLDWYPLMWDYNQGIKYKVLSAKYLESQKKSPKLDFRQEYCCDFTSNYSSFMNRSDLTFKDKTSKNYTPSRNLLTEIGRDYGDSEQYYRN
jgi:hypothetical protein